jgi:hypothetical protein
MTEFTLLFRGSDPAARSPEQTQKSMEKWLAWFKELNAKGVIANPGHPLDRAGKVVEGRQKAVHDGPYAEPRMSSTASSWSRPATFPTRWKFRRAVLSLRTADRWRYARSAS